MRFMEKAAQTTVDEVFLDLEDSVAPNKKVEARAMIVKALREFDWSGKTVVVRVNDISTQWFYGDLIEVVEGAGEKIDAIMQPKVHRPEDVYVLDTLLSQIELKMGFNRRIGIEAQIESAAGMANVERIAHASPRLVSLIFGPGDYAASCGIPVFSIGTHGVSYPGHLWHYAISRIVSAAKSAGLDAIDGPYGAIADIEGLTRSAQMARLLGCDGKWAVHPSQIEPITRAFSPTEEELRRARMIAERYEAATEREGVGAVMLDGDMIDAASLKLAERALEKAKRIG